MRFKFKKTRCSEFLLENEKSQKIIEDLSELISYELSVITDLNVKVDDEIFRIQSKGKDSIEKYFILSECSGFIHATNNDKDVFQGVVQKLHSKGISLSKKNIRYMDKLINRRIEHYDRLIARIYNINSVIAVGVVAGLISWFLTPIDTLTNQSTIIDILIKMLPFAAILIFLVPIIMSNKQNRHLILQTKYLRLIQTFLDYYDKNVTTKNGP
ncbi:MAG: hypothetical protein BAA01_03215 [Bacillus thermozeamaize]|uniref:Uncharacterized protein n=1 Tax=Bacillus thermozeamaize TaxID=230954 RepID=A0A1Y3PMN0_9BACI|nr:MAG: hypothetical protein BAA01_03215 [Bacillus thermozeamaize]